ncbi:MAG: acylneuraminate cytidylyltransferase family protein [Anaerolineaceae bacterium]|nr:acylneuraminate cytidylyltransferase family protein [Anaerolineaceae bacterium]
MKIAALVPMRHHSQRVPEKNFRVLAGKPLYQHILDQLSLCVDVDEIVVDTDSPVISEGVKKSYPSVTLLQRPEHLRADHISMNEILLNDTSQVKADYYLQTHSTNPLLKAATISDAIQTLLKSIPEYDSLFSATPMKTRLWDQLSRPINHNPSILLQTQDLPPVYEENSCMYIFTREILLERRNRLGYRPYLYAMDPAESWDIDEELDFLITDVLLSHQNNQK